METTIRRFPIGIQTFAEIISGKYLYIDKTGYINDIADKYKYVFLNRPLGFGKSLLSSTFHCYFEGRKELFEGLKAGEMKKEWIKHPVFHFDMSTAKHLNEEQLVRILGYKLEEYEAIYGKLPNVDDIDVNARLEFLVKTAFEQTGQQAVIIIDEYDAPLLDVINDNGKMPALKQIMRNFYGPIKSMDQYLRFVFITGVNKSAQLGISGELNNFQDISMMPEYSALCGISQTEFKGRETKCVKLGREMEVVSC